MTDSMRARIGSNPRVKAVRRRIAEDMLADRERQVRQLTKAVETLGRRHYGDFQVPEEELRLHVGTNPTIANFLAQGVSSSQRVLEVFGESPDGPVLDWGCGTGRTRRWLEAYPGWREHYRGTDVDADAIAWLRAAGVANLEVCRDDPPLPYDGASLNGVFAFSVLTHIPPARHRAWYEELRRVLAPGGRAYLTYQGARILEDAGPDVLVEARREFGADGHAYVELEGHYKDAAFVSESFTREALAGLFEVDSFEPVGYQNMDVVLARAV